MNLQETLTKENFWNEMMERYPDATKHFCDWIDEYKKSVNWNRVFNSDSTWQDYSGKNAPAPKFHDLPHAMQEGIWFAYLRDDNMHGGWIRDHGNMHSFSLDRNIPYYFHYKQEAINKKTNLQ